VETAKKAGRTGFRKIFGFLRVDPACQLLVEKTDRLYHNLPGIQPLGEIDPTIHFVKANQLLSKDSKSTERLMHEVKLVMAKNYIDNLSEETRNGMLEKARQGLWPSYAPPGDI
jgi:DNA invertase Pin-like site-specific DNA recombinase